MPIYEYSCIECGQKSELLIANPAKSGDLKCPACGSINLAKLVSLPGPIKDRSATSGKTCCGREERCDKPPCDSDNHCRRDH